MKKLAFWVLLLLPLSALAYCAAGFLVKVSAVNHVDHGKVYSELETYFSHRKGLKPIEFRTEGGVFGYQWPGASFYSVHESPAFIPFEFTPQEYVVFVFGESSVTLPRRDQVFAAWLEKELALIAEEKGKKVRVVNLGYSGIDLFSVKERVIQALAVKKPDLVIVYSGHNDYNATYRNIIKPHYYLPKDRLSSMFINRVALPMYKVNNFFAREVFFEPRVLRLLQKAGVVRFNNGDFAQYNGLIMRYYRANMEGLIDACRSNGVPLICMTLVSNYEAKPFGVNSIVDPVYARGMLEKEYAPRVALLREAKDLEAFSGDIRAKSPMNEYIRTLRSEGVYVFDLEQAFIDRKVPFDSTTFIDYFHFREDAHKLVAGLLSKFITDNGLMR